MLWTEWVNVIISLNVIIIYEANGHLVEKIDIGNHGNADEEIAKVGEHYQHLST